MQADAGYKIVELANGTRSVHSVAHRETFHPVVGPVAEAEALYVRQLRLPERAESSGEEFVIWDVGLGAAANVLTVLDALSGITARARIVSFDHTLAPLRFALEHAESLGYLMGWETQVHALLAEGVTSFDRNGLQVLWEFHPGDFPTLLSSPKASVIPKPHAVLYDAFSPAKNPAMWTLGVFKRLHEVIDPQRPCSLATYSRSTLLRVTLLLAGFYVGAGHATGEKEETTIAANQPGLIETPLDQRWLQRSRNSTSAEPLHEAAYRQAPLTVESWNLLEQHPQFRSDFS